MNRLKNSRFYQLLHRLDASICGWWNRSALGQWLTCQDASRSVFTPAQLLAPRLRELLHSVLGWVPMPKFPVAVLLTAAALILAPFINNIVTVLLVCPSICFAVLSLASDRNAGLTPSPLNVHIGLYAFVVFWTTIFSVYFLGSLMRGALFTVYILFFFCVTSVGLDRHLNKVLWLMLAAGLCVSLYGLYQYCFPERYGDVWSDTDMFPTITVRVYSTLENPNVLGEYLLLVIPVAVAFAFAADSWKKRAACLAAAVIMFVCLLLTYSRGCYLGLLFGAAIFLVLLDRRFLFLGIIAVALCPLYLPESIITRFTSIGNLADSSTSYRLNIWMGTLSMLKDFGLTGIGPDYGTFVTVYPFYAIHGVSAAHAHSLYLQILCDSGIVGLLVFLGLIVSFYRMMLTAIRHELDRSARLMQIGGVSAVSGFLLQGLTDYTFYDYQIMLLFFGMLGLCVLFTRMGRQEARA